MKFLRIFLLIIMFCVSTLANTQEEIGHLLNFIEKSTCKCERNGILYNCKEAKEHILTKYKYFKKRGKIHSSEDFIRYSASKSELSGKKYRAHCSSMIEDSSDWLQRELISYRKKQL